ALQIVEHSLAASMMVCQFLLERLAMWLSGHTPQHNRSPVAAADRVGLYCQINWILLAVVGGCTALFMVGAILAYDPARGFLARRGEPGGGT
ncbi:MAG TPA: hypothetical protein VF760_02385, partial [Xanthobacteraceae bacterium]